MSLFYMTLVRAANRSKTVQRGVKTNQFFSFQLKPKRLILLYFRIIFFFVLKLILIFFPPQWIVHHLFPRQIFIGTKANKNSRWKKRKKNLRRSSNRRGNCWNESSGVKSEDQKWLWLNKRGRKRREEPRCRDMSIHRLFDNGWLVTTWCWLQLG